MAEKEIVKCKRISQRPLELQTEFNENTKLHYFCPSCNIEFFDIIPKQCPCCNQRISRHEKLRFRHRAN